MPWELKLEFNDTLCCKLYSKLSYADEDSELTAPPPSPVTGFKYPPLVKLRQLGSPVSMQDVIEKCYLYEDIRSQKLNSKRLNSLQESVVDVDQVKTLHVSITLYSVLFWCTTLACFGIPKLFYTALERGIRDIFKILTCKDIANAIQDDVPRVQPLLSSRYIRRCNGEKLRSMADSRVTKYYSEGSIFLKESIDDVNEDKELIVSREKFEEHHSKKCKPKICVPKSTVDSRVSFDILRKSYKGSSSGNKSKEFSGSNIVGRNGVERNDLQTSPYTLFGPSEGISECTVTKTDKTQSIIVESVTSVEEKDVATAVWNHALLANRSSKSSHSYYSISGNNGTSQSKDISEKYSFLRTGNLLRSNDRTVVPSIEELPKKFGRGREQNKPVFHRKVVEFMHT